MSILLPPKHQKPLPSPRWLPGPERPSLPVDELHIWRVCLEEPRWGAGTEASRPAAESLRMALYRQDVLERYTAGESGCVARMLAGPASGLRIAVAECDHIALIAVSRNVREVGLDVERVRVDIPFEEMADGFLDEHSQWELRITWSAKEKARKFFRFWTWNEACAQARPFSRASQPCKVRGFAPERDFIAALAVEGGPEADVIYWDWAC